MTYKNIKHAYAFATTYPGWHTMSQDRATKNAISWLEKRGLVEVKGDQFKATSPFSTSNPFTQLRLRKALADLV